ncbi:leucine-rich repeat protein [Candidatus Peribacteria bacterium]|nr:leucine-rich repeat protein [Candidatus Peribacteria bacterium]
MSNECNCLSYYSESVTYIGSAAFAQNQLTSVTIPDSVTDLADFAFNNNQITSVTIPAGITQLSGWVFFTKSNSFHNYTK